MARGRDCSNPDPEPFTFQGNTRNRRRGGPMRVTVIAGGVGGARYLKGLSDYAHTLLNNDDQIQITAIVNVGDDMWMNGLRITPDLDSIMYTLAGENDADRGWGRKNETERISQELSAYGLGNEWFTLGDLDFATHIARSSLLRDGHSLSTVTSHLCARWDIGVSLIPVTNDEVETRVHIREGETLHFQQWWVQHRASLPVEKFEFHRAESAAPSPGVIEAILETDRVIIAPSNPVVSVAPVFAIPGVGDAIRTTTAPVIGVSPIIGGKVVRGMADSCLRAIGVKPDACDVALHYGARSRGGLIDAWLVDTVDSPGLPILASAGLRAKAVPLWLTSQQASMQLAQETLMV